MRFEYYQTMAKPKYQQGRTVVIVTAVKPFERNEKVQIKDISRTPGSRQCRYFVANERNTGWVDEKDLAD